MSFCPNCGAPLPASAHFCPQCGTDVEKVAAAAAPIAPAQVAPPSAQPAPPPNVEPVAPPNAEPVAPPKVERLAPPAAPPPRAPRRTAGRGAGSWWVVPLVIVGIIVIAWIVLAMLPFGGGADSVPATETVAEAPPPTQTTTLVEVPDPAQRAGANASVQMPPVQIATEAPATATDQPPPEAGAGEMSEGQAGVRLSNYIVERNYYKVAEECVQVRGRGYKNKGYTFEVWHSCRGGGNPRLLGRWRVDSERGEIFRQRADGRYLDP